MPKFAANLSLMFTETGFLARFGAAREAGFEAVEFQFPYAFAPGQLAEQLQRHRLQAVLHNLPAGDWDAGERGLACDPRRTAQFQDSVGLGIDYARALDVRRLHCMAGLLPPDIAREQAHAAYVANLRYAAAQCAAHGIALLIEPINDHDVPGYFLTGTRQACALIAETGADNLYLQYDLYHMQRMEGKLAATLRRCLPLIRHIQLADVPGRHQPGTGGISFPRLFRLLDELGYDGWVGCEYVPRGPTVASLGWLEQERQRG